MPGLTSEAPRLGHYLPCSVECIESVVAQPATQRLTSFPKRLGEILLDRGLISHQQLVAGIRAQRVDRLARCSLFGDIAFDELSGLSEAFHEVTVENGEVFIAQGDIDTHLYVLASGELEVFRVDDDGEELRLATVAPGEPVGEIGYVTGAARSASVRALGRCELLRSEYSALQRQFAEIPKLSSAFLDVVTRRLVDTTGRFEQEHRQLRRAEHSLDRLGKFLDFSQVVEIGTGIERLLERLVETASELTDADRASLFLIDGETGELWSKVAQGDDVREIRVPAGQGVAGWVSQQQKLVNISDAYNDERFRKRADQQSGYCTRTLLCAPIRSLSGDPLGVVQVINKREGAFTTEDEMYMRAFAHQAAIAVENFNLYRGMVESHNKMSILLELASSVNGTLDLGDLIARIVSLTTEALQCERSSFFVVDDEAGELYTMEFQGAEVTSIRLSLSTGLAGYSASTGDVVNVIDAYRDPRFNPEVDIRTGFCTKSVLCVPVVNRDGHITGVTECINRQGGAFDDDDVILLRAISSQISIALDNARLHANEVDMRNYLENVHRSIASGILTLDEQGMLVTMNRAAERIFPQFHAGRNERDYRHFLGETNRHICDLIDRAYERRQALSEHDLNLRHPKRGGDIVTVNINVLPLNDNDGVFKGLVLVIEDITKEKRLKSAFSHYVSPAVVEKLVADPGIVHLGGETREVSVLFTDIEGFTAVSEGVDPGDLVKALNEYFDDICSVVLPYGGTIDKIVADSLTVLFNAPLDQPNHAERAVSCALELNARSRNMKVLHPSNPISFTRTRIGVHTGLCVVGNFGGASRFDYTAHGDTMNTASRLEGANKYLGSRICVSASTMRRCGDIPFRPLGKLLMKGKKDPIDVFEPLCEEDASDLKTKSYIEAYQAMFREDNRAPKMFRDLAERYPNDSVIQFHAKRMARGSRGATVRLTQK